MVAVFLIWARTSILFSIVAAPVALVLTVHEDSLFSTSLSTHVISCLFANSDFNRCEMTSHCGLDLHFPDDW